MSSITEVLQFYYPHWSPPDNEKEWNPCLCPAHSEDDPSCAVSFENDAVKCQACGFKGNSVSIVKRMEKCNYGAALRKAERIAQESGGTVPKSGKRKSGRPVFE